MKNVILMTLISLSACESLRVDRGTNSSSTPVSNPAAPAAPSVSVKASSLVIKSGSTVVAYIVGIGGWGSSSSNFAITVLTPQGYLQRVNSWTGELFNESLYRYYTSANCTGVAYVDDRQTPFMHLRFGDTYYKTHSLVDSSTLTIQSRLSSSGVCSASASSGSANVVSLDEITAPNNYSDIAPLQMAGE